MLDAKTIRRAFDAASDGYDRAAVVHSEIRARLIERLDLVRIEPSLVLDLGAGTGHASRHLQRRYRQARVVAFDASVRMLQEAAKQQGFWRRFGRVVADARALPLPPTSVDLVFSNLMLQWCAEPDAVFAEIRRVLRPSGLFTFTSVGPDTLRELRTAWRAVDRRPHVHAFIDMHDLGDALVRAGFAEPVLDTERLTITYSGFDAMLTELRASGSCNAAPDRHRGLTTPRQLSRVREAYATESGALPVTLEVVYGQAWVGEPREQSARGPTETRVPLEALKRRRLR